MSNDDIKKLIAAMKEEFPTISMYAHLEETVDKTAEKVNDVADRVSRLMTREDAISLFDMATLKAEHAHMKKIIHEKLHVEV